MVIGKFCIAQEANETFGNSFFNIESVNPSDSNYQDLYFLDSLFQDIDVVFLGEQAHGEGNVTLAKTRLIKYLNMELGFNIIVFEAGFYDAYLAGVLSKSMSNTDEIFKSAIPAIWYNTMEFGEMKKFLKEKIKPNVIQLYGIDCQLKALAHNTLFKYLKKRLHGIDYSLDSTSVDLLNKYVWGNNNSGDRYFDNNIDSVNVFQLLDELILESKKINSKPLGFWSQTISNLKTNLVLNINNFYGILPVFALNNIRDKQMAENLLWIINHKNKNDKIIIWSASMHNARNIKMIEEVDDTIFYNNYITMGQLVYDSIGNKMYSLAFSSSGGYYQAPYIMEKAIEITSKQEKSIESIFHNNQIKYGIVNFRGTDANGYFWNSMYSNPHGHKNVKAIWPMIHDGIFYIDTVQPPNIITK